MPDSEGHLLSRFQHSQYLVNRIHRRWKEHHTEAADDSIERIGCERQMVCKGDVKLGISEGETV